MHDWDVLEVGAGVQAPALAEHQAASAEEPFVSQGPPVGYNYTGYAPVTSSL